MEVECETQEDATEESSTNTEEIAVGEGRGALEAEPVRIDDEKGR